MRLFLAVEIDENVRAAAARLASALERAAGRSGLSGRVRWVAPANLHVTLRFLGEVGAPFEQGLRNALAAPLAVAPFDLQVGGIGLFPPEGRPRVVWAGLGPGAHAVQLVHRALAPRLDAAGVPPEDRPFRPHVTLGRVRESRRGAAGALRQAFEGIDADLGTCRVAHVTLFESRPGPRGPSYHSRLTVPLSGAA